MIRSASFILSLLLLVTPAAGQQVEPGDIAHGAEKAVQKEVHPGEQHGSDVSHAPKTYFGIPGWILKIVNMLLFIGLLVYLLRGPVNRAFAERAVAIRQAAEQARERRAKADQLASDIQARLTAIEQEVRSIRERAEMEGEKQKRDLIAAAEAEAAKIIQSARNEVDNRLKHARKELTEYAGQLATERAESILRERINESDQQKIFRDSLREVGEA